MNVLERVKLLADDYGISIPELEKKLGFGNGSVYKWGKSMPSADKLSAVADFFNVTTDYLLGRTDSKHDSKSEEHKPQLTTKDQMEIDDYLDNFENDLLSQTGLMFDGEPMTDESKEKLLAALRIGAEMAKKEAKEKYTPKKYRK